MNKLVATQPMLRAMRRLRKDDAIQKFIQKAAAGKLKLQKAPGPLRKPEPRPGEPTPQRVEKADPGAVVAVTSPPFNSRVLPLVTRYADRLGPDIVLALEQFAEMRAKGQGKRGLTAGYDGFKVDTSRTDYSHLTPAESKAHNRFHRVMQALPAELRPIVTELLFDEEGRKPLTIARELSGYDSEHHQRGALVTALRIIAWLVRDELSKGARNGQGRARKAEEVLLP
jgi:hypothetical protein